MVPGGANHSSIIFHSSLSAARKDPLESGQGKKNYAMHGTVSAIQSSVAWQGHPGKDEKEQLPHLQH